METVHVMINGAPGNVARMLIRHVARDSRFALVPYSLTGPEIEAAVHQEEATTIRLVPPDRRREALTEILRRHGNFISVDFTHPSAVNANAEFYCAQGLPFVMGTTGGDRQHLAATVEASSIAAVIAPNMARQIVGFQAMMAFGAENFPGLFQGYRLHIRESHQRGKADTSGTAKAMVAYFRAMGVDVDPEEIEMLRDPEVQRRELGVPEAFLGGHAWHSYSLVSPDETVHFEFVHNVNGRDIYAEGVLAAVVFLRGQLAAGARGRVFSMMDVLKG
jgi:4-hydroxy-tetrahydrodipicolinate reductase